MRCLVTEKEELKMEEKFVNQAFTENGDQAYSSTLDVFLDLFAVLGSSRRNPKIVKPLFNKALRLDFRKALALLLYTRDIRGGLGERDTFRVLLKIVAERMPDVARKLIPLVPLYGRYDDLFSLLSTPCEKEMAAFVKKVLEEDSKSGNAQISLLSKWMPSINCHKRERRKQGERMASLLGMSPTQYRKLLSTLRQGRIIENDLRTMDYSFDYAKVPSLAMSKYRQAFLRNDAFRYQQYLQDVRTGKEKMNAAVLYPYDIIREYHENMTESEKVAMEEKWKRMKEELPSMKNTIVVRDGSASMLDYDAYPMQVATSLSILFSEYLEGPFKDSFITFSSRPKLVTFKENSSLSDKLREVDRHQDCSNTNIRKVYELLAKMESKAKEEEQIRRVIIISDMEFDRGVEDVPTYETFSDLFRKKGLVLPQIVYLNVCSRHIRFSATKDRQVLLLSGAGKNLLKLLSRKDFPTPLEFMEETISPYRKKIDELYPKEN